MVRRPWLVPVLASLIAVALLVAGVVAWRMMATSFAGASCPPQTSCSLAPEFRAPHRLHPLRAELLWAASAAFAFLAVGSGLWHWRRPTTVPPAMV